MHIEERIEQQEKLIEQLLARVEELEKREKPEEYVTPKQLAEMMNCSANTVYIKIRSGEIKAVHIGSNPKIPMNQFEITNQEQAVITHKKERKEKEKSIKELVFG